MTENNPIIQVWFFVGIMFLLYGLLILGSGIAEWPHPPNTVLSNLHAPVWWGGLMTLLGAAYSIRYRPGRKKAS
ncbi:MAG: hypothetical protein WA789_10230 [Candidatus Acidiferrum sp.]